MASTYNPRAAEHFIAVTQIYFCAMCTKFSFHMFFLHLTHVISYIDAVVLWDWIISLHREWIFVWKTHWTPVKVAYLFCRYWVITVVPYLLYCFVADHSLENCEKIFRIPVALAMWNQVSSQVILLIRTYAFFNKNIYVLAALLTALSGVISYQLYVDIMQMLLLPFAKAPYDRGPCFPRSKPHSAHLLGFFIAPLLFDTLVTAMTVCKAITIRRQHGGPNSRLIQTFIREGIFYYILISIANLINGIFYLQPQQTISAINIPLSVMLGPVLACRLILDLRERGSQTVSHSEGTGIAAFTTKSMTQQQCSPFTPPGRHHKSRTGGHDCRSHEINTIRSNIMLTTIGSIAPSHDNFIDQDVVDIEDVRFGPYVDIGSLSTAIGGDDGEPIPDVDIHHNWTPTPTYHSLEMGFRGGPTRSSLGTPN